MDTRNSCFIQPTPVPDRQKAPIGLTPGKGPARHRAERERVENPWPSRLRGRGDHARVFNSPLQSWLRVRTTIYEISYRLPRKCLPHWAATSPRRHSGNEYKPGSHLVWTKQKRYSFWDVSGLPVAAQTSRAHHWRIFDTRTTEAGASTSRCAELGPDYSKVSLQSDARCEAKTRIVPFSLCNSSLGSWEGTWSHLHYALRVLEELLVLGIRTPEDSHRMTRPSFR
ncbi:hypothetical protein QBC47DRAFT_368544 [Echria macrotheca]|uniref:Uncharacterized protein n=1 Tax=Echria macrotheca TaxID=438768 RepID=A0AAJ0FHA8_9PEZI|nr:hypothetical protein QBC47DRAFT_368544 [Echria macrotheca]